MNSFKIKTIYFLAVIIGLFFCNFAFASTTDGTIDATYKYAWSENIGWINFGCDSCNVHVTDSVLTGYIWSQNYGRINLNPSNNSGVQNDGNGNLSGYAWSENIGPINFSGVTIDSNGQFQGEATGDNTGKINFNYDPTSGCPTCQIVRVITDWRPASSRPSAAATVATSGGGAHFSSGALSSPASPISVAANNGVQYATSSIVILNLKAGSDVAMMSISNYPDFSNASQEVYSPTKSWDLCSGRPTEAVCPADNTIYTIYVKFFTANYGIPSAVISSNIIYVKQIPQKTFIEKLPPFIQPFIPPFLKPTKPIVVPSIPIEQLISKEAPSAMSGKWILLDQRAINRLVFAPLPQDIAMLTEKIPQLEKTFSSLGIARMTDLEKIRTAGLNLPGLTQSLNLPLVNIAPGKLALPKGVPLAQLSPQIKQKLPTEIVFASTGGQLIDFNAVLSLNSKGQPQQKINTVVGKPLELTVKPEKPVKSIKGYLVFKSKTPEPSVSMSFPFGSLVASLISANPVVSQKQAEPINLEQKLVLAEFEYTDPDGDGIYTAEVPAPAVEGEYEVITVIDYQDSTLGRKVISLITVVDPEGYVYEKDSSGRETRIPGAIVFIDWLNPDTKKYELWPAEKYQQENLQTTDVTGKYSFIVPEGFYSLVVDAPGYISYEGKPFEVTEGSGVHINIELKTKYWWLHVIDWKDIVIIIIIFMLCYNFYRDRKRDALLCKEKNIK